MTTMMLSLTGCIGWSVSTVGPTGAVEGAAGNSSLSDAGAEQIRRAGSASFDWSSGRLLLQDVGLTGAGDFANGVSASDPAHPIAVTIHAPSGTIEVPSDRILPYVAEGSEEIDELWLTVSASDDEQFLSFVREYASTAGIESEGLTEWVAAYAADPASTCTSLGYNTPVGTATGLDLWLEMSCTWDQDPRRYVAVHITPPQL
ncbi:hypothetical protein [Microbacterium nymphoidis]|uniref:hypothetical protein n=1 Tax=Microbacterium nymphoidis TaxID=2898586 RepID=UPI001E5BD7E7|nr:hypothetical protein [Microbacterium nymphoidis]MCD2497370.1 hypothetical protein [Microbacterium nymphoidis]